ncbi:calmodulin [Acrasis kona]|uniref:Calmodulin n=1 Tax=Acrasis kona TaxID=1008807 RepID=A0AAW2ZBK9_9EUKA
MAQNNHTALEVVAGYFENFVDTCSGCIYHCDLRHLLEDMGMPSHFLTKQYLDAVVDLVISHDEEHISFDRFFKFWKVVSRNGFERLDYTLQGLNELHRSFKLHDKDNDMHLNYQEFHQLFVTLELHREGPVEDFINQIDVDVDGSFSYKDCARVLGYTEMSKE